MEVMCYILAIMGGISFGYLFFHVKESNSNLSYGIEIIKSELLNINLKIEKALNKIEPQKK